MYFTLMAKKSADQHIFTLRIGQIGTFLRKNLRQVGSSLGKKRGKGRANIQSGWPVARSVGLCEGGGKGTFARAGREGDIS